MDIRFSKIWYIITITLCLLIELISSQQMPDCSRAEYNRCTSLADPLLKEPHLVFPDNMADIELVCLTWNQFVDCLKSYTDRCFTPQQRKKFNKAVENPIESVHQMCTQRTYQQEYLQHATCIKSTVTQHQHCGDQYTQLVNQVSQGEAISRSHLCCSHDRFRRCVTLEARRICDRGVPNGNAVRFAEQIIDKALSFLQDQCFNYIPNSGDCISVNYKASDDQLAMSTSPWYSTKTGQTDQDTVSTGGGTGVTVLDMSSSDHSGSSRMPGYSTGYTGQQSPGGYTGQQSPGYAGQQSSGFKGIDTKVTDVAWMPSNAANEGSTMNKDGGTMDGGSTRPDSTSGTSLGSRTRPSSYGRSSGWDTNPAQSPNPTPPTRPDWATVSSWHVYSTGDRGQNNPSSSLDNGNTNIADRGNSNFSPFGPSTNMDKKTTHNNNNRMTTETWYPAAGSHVGNEVDEPNQLGLSKPKHSGAPKRVVGVELSLTMVATVLAAYC